MQLMMEQRFQRLPFRLPRTARRSLSVALVAALSIALWFSGLPGLAYYTAAAAIAGHYKTGSLSLSSYRAVMNGHPVAGLSRNLSGLTYSDTTETLFAVINRPAEIVELSTGGQLLRRIKLKGLSDPEGITHTGGNGFIISDEATQSLHWIEINPPTTNIDVVGGSELRMDIGSFRNMGFEGLSWDARDQRLFVAQEMLPSRILVIDGMADSMASKGMHLSIAEWKQRDLAGFFLLDLSSVTLHEGTGNLVLLSQMSSMLVEYNQDGAVLSALPLWGGLNGLEHSIGQAEGVAIGPNDDVFIVAEPNLFYRFASDPTLLN